MEPGLRFVTLGVTRVEADRLQDAAAAGGRIVKAAGETDWVGYGGYFAGPGGYLWEVAWQSRVPARIGGWARGRSRTGATHVEWSGSYEE